MSEKKDTAGPSEEGPNMLNYWYPFAYVGDVGTMQPYPFELYGEPMVCFRDATKKPVVFQDRCPHRSVPLSIGKLDDGKLQCRYHGWAFDSTGKCVFLPSISQDKIPPSLCVHTYPCTEKEGMVWVWPGDPTKADLNVGFPPECPEINSVSGKPVEGWVTYDQLIDNDYSYHTFTENLLDPAHLQFTHEGTQGQYIAPTNVSIPEASMFEMDDTPEYPDGFRGVIKTNKTHKPQNLTIVMYPPVLERIEIVFENGWRFHQNHYICPTSKHKTRVLVRSLRDWIKWLPDALMWRTNPKVLRQDACILMAQQLRLNQGSSRWNYPVKSDAMGVRYRQWHAKAEKSNPWFKGYSGSSFKKGGGVSRCHVDDIEDTYRCHDTKEMLDGSDSVSLKTIRQILSEAPTIWPNELVKKGENVSQSMLSFYNLTKK